MYLIYTVGDGSNQNRPSTAKTTATMTPDSTDKTRHQPTREIAEALQLVWELHMAVTGQDTQQLHRFHWELLRLLGPLAGPPHPPRSD